MMEYEPHECAEIFPMLPKDKLAELADDIRKNGVKEPGTLYQGKILDGRNRAAACEIAGKEMWWEEYEEGDVDPIAFVLSKNLHRRHLDKSQQGMCAARARKLYDQQAKERQKRKPQSVPESLPEQQHADARDAAGRAFGVSGKQVDKGSKVLRKGAKEVVEAVDAGELSLNAAADLVEAVSDKGEQAKTVRSGRKAVAEKTKARPKKAKRVSAVEDDTPETEYSVDDPVFDEPPVGTRERLQDIYAAHVGGKLKLNRQEVELIIGIQAGRPLTGATLDQALQVIALHRPALLASREQPDEADPPSDRVAWVKERLGWLWDKYQAAYGDRAERSCFVMAWESLSIEKGWPCE